MTLLSTEAFRRIPSEACRPVRQTDLDVTQADSSSLSLAGVTNVDLDFDRVRWTGDVLLFDWRLEDCDGLLKDMNGQVDVHNYQLHLKLELK